MPKVILYFRTVGKVVVGFWATFAVGVAAAHSIDYSVSAVATATIFFLGTMACAVSGWHEFQIEAHLDNMREFGRAAGSIGKPPDFYRRDGTKTDVADEIAIMQGWDLGWKEFQALPEEQRVLYADLNRREGYLSVGSGS